MNSIQKMIMNAQDALDLAKANLHDDRQHELVGYNLAHACELFMKALCEMRGLAYPRDKEGHDLDVLMQTLEEGGFSAISSHEDVIALTPYNSTAGRHTVLPKERVELSEMLTNVESLKKLVGEALRSH